MLSVIERLYLNVGLPDEEEVRSACEGASFLGSTTDKILNVMPHNKESYIY